MRFILLFLGILSIQITAKAQEKNNFVLLYSGDKIFGKNVTLDSKLFKRDKIVVDNTEYELKNVKF